MEKSPAATSQSLVEYKHEAHESLEGIRGHLEPLSTHKTINLDLCCRHTLVLPGSSLEF